MSYLHNSVTTRVGPTFKLTSRALQPPPIRFASLTVHGQAVAHCEIRGIRPAVAEECRVHRAQIWRATDSGDPRTERGPFSWHYVDLAVLSPNMAISEIALTGSVCRIAGSDDESGTAILKYPSSGSARSDISSFFRDTRRSEVSGKSRRCPKEGIER